MSPRRPVGSDDDDPAVGGDSGSETTESSGGGGDSDGAITAVTIVAQDISFDTTSLSASAGDTLDITYDKQGSLRHSLHVTGEGVDEATEVTAGPVTQELTVTLGAAGEYEFFCDVHPGQMNGTITVS